MVGARPRIPHKALWFDKGRQVCPGKEAGFMLPWDWCVIFRNNFLSQYSNALPQHKGDQLRVVHRQIITSTHAIVMLNLSKMFQVAMA